MKFLMVLAFVFSYQPASLDSIWVWREVVIDPTGKRFEYPHSEVLIKADGRWKKTRIVDGAKEVTYGDGNGIFSHFPGDRVIFREADFRPLPTLRQFISDEAEKRNDTMLDHEAIVYRQRKPDGWLEVWIIPALGRQRPARIVTTNLKGSFTLEAISIERREISEAELALPRLPIQRRRK
jgi:hypothetical protein